MDKIPFTKCVKFVGVSPQKFDGEKLYVSTGALDRNLINMDNVELVTYDNRPSRANLVAEKGDIIFAKMANTEKTLLLDEITSKNIYSTGFYAVRANKKVILPGCLFYLLGSKAFLSQKDINSSGATQKAITNQGLEKVYINVPEMSEQKEIVKIFSELSQIIKKRELQLLYLDKIIKSRFVEMFGDPISNPMRWKLRTFKESSIILSDGPFGSNLKSEHYCDDEGIRIIRLQNIGVGKFVDTDKAFIPQDHYEKIEKYTCYPGEIVIGTMGTPNLRACIIPDNINKAIHKADCVRFVPKKELLNNIFACQYINCPETLSLASDKIHGQTRARISSGQVALLQIYLPPIDLQNQFAAFVQQVDKLKFEVQKSLDEMQQLFDSLMQKYFG
jgi:type I restriction enzyme, S subunit